MKNGGLELATQLHGGKYVNRKWLGLGLPKLTSMNEALLAKLLWRMVSKLHELSSNILIEKYGGWSALVHGSNGSVLSHIWRSLKRVFLLLHARISWKLGNGKTCSFWYDIWFGEHPLADLCSIPIPQIWSVMTVNEFWQCNEGLNFTLLAKFLPAGTLEDLRSCPLIVVQVERMFSYGKRRHPNFSQ